MNPPNCANIWCKNQLTDYELGRLNGRQSKYIFCKRCRVNYSRGYKVLSWKCKSCGGLLNSNQFQLTRKYCNLDCRYESQRQVMFKTEKKCVLCGKSFFAKWGKYCSQVCSNRYQKMKHKDVRLCLIPS